jgi:hypothetical protein
MHFSLKNWRKAILKTDQWNTISTGNVETRSGATSCTATSATAVRSVPASGAHTEALVWPLVTTQRRRPPTHAVRGKWLGQVARIRRPAHRPWRAIPGHALGLPTRASGTGTSLPTPTDLPCAYKPAPAVPYAHTFPPEPPPSAIGAARCEPSSGHRPHAPKHLSPPLCSTKPPRAACCASRAMHSPEPVFPRPPPDRRHRARSFVASPSPATCLAPSLGHMEATRVACGWAKALPSPPSSFPRARPLLRRRRSPETPPADPPPSIDHWWVQSTIPIACLRGRAPPRRRRACPHRRARGEGTKGICVRILKVLGFAVQKDCSLFCELVQHLVK